jgi:hypothetical protein
MGLFTRSTKVSDDLLENGIRGTATVEKADMRGVLGVTEYSGYMSQKHQEQLLTGETSMTKYKLALQVQLPGRTPYAATVTVPVPAMKTKFMTGGSVLPVLADPNKDDHIAVDWDGEFKVGTVAQMAGANLLIAAALKGAGVDVDKISEMQAAQIAAGQTPSNVIMGGQLLGTTPPPVAPDPLEQLKKLGELHASGVLTDAEFETQKTKILAQ